MRQRLIWLLPFFLPLLYILIASLNIKYPGINYDEIFWGNAALGALDETFIKRVLGLPLFIHDYIGALKPWLIAPVFRLFGVSVITVRLPMIIIAAVALVCLYFTVRSIFGSKKAIIATILTSFDTSFIIHTRLDYGPVVLSYFFRVISLFLFFLYIKKRNKPILLALFITLVLGFYNKFDFIWFINALLLSAYIFYRKETYKKYWSKLTKRVKILLVFAITGLIVCGFIILQKIHFFKFIDFFYFSHLIRIITGTFHLINGQSFYNYMIGRLYTIQGFLYSLFVIGIIAINTFIRFKSNISQNKQYYFLVIMLGAIFLQIIITSNAGASWHLIYAYPFVQILLADSLANLFNNKTKIMTLITIILAGYQIMTYGKYIQGFAGPMKNPQWSKAIYTLIDYTKRTNSKFVSVDWGTHNQLLVFNGVRNKFYNEWVWFIKDPVPEREYKRIVNQEYKNPNMIFITYAADKSNFFRTRKMFFQIAKENHFMTKKIKDIKDGDEVIFELYKVYPTGLTE